MSTALIIKSAAKHRLETSKEIKAKRKGIIASALAVMLLTGSTWSVAAEKAEPNRPPMSMHGKQGMPMGKGMGGMEGMMEMMGSCNHMMQGGMMGSTMPQLPPGNEKLQLQMQAEMMQKMGETLAKYATQIKEEKK